MRMAVAMEDRRFFVCSKRGRGCDDKKGPRAKCRAAMSNMNLAVAAHQGQKRLDTAGGVD